MVAKVVNLKDRRDQEVVLDRLRAHYLGLTYTAFKERKAELKAQIRLMEKMVNAKPIPSRYRS